MARILIDGPQTGQSWRSGETTGRASADPHPPTPDHRTGKKISVRHFDWSVSLPGSVT